MAAHSSTLTWKIPWMEEPGRLQSMGSLGVGHNWVLYFHFSLSCIGEGNGNPLQCSHLENPMDGGAWWAAIYGVTVLPPAGGAWAAHTHIPWGSGSSTGPDDCHSGSLLTGCPLPCSLCVPPPSPGHGSHLQVAPSGCQNNFTGV